MKNIPYPDKRLSKKKDVAIHISDLVFNAMTWLKIDGYLFWVLLPGDDSFIKHDGAGLSVRLDFPYKKFYISVQQDSIDKMLAAKKDAPLFKHIERSIFHELFHVIVWNMSEISTKRFTTPTAIEEAEENTVDHLANCFYPLVEEIRSKKKKK